MNVLEHASIKRPSELKKIQVIKNDILQYFSLDQYSLKGKTFCIPVQWLAEAFHAQLKKNTKATRFVVEREELRILIHTNMFTTLPDRDIRDTIIKMPLSSQHTFVNTLDEHNKKEVFLSSDWEKYMIFEDYYEAENVTSEIINHFQKDAHQVLKTLPFMTDAIILDKK